MKKIEGVDIRPWLLKKVFLQKDGDGGWYFMHVCYIFGSQMKKKSSMFGISEWSPRKTVGPQRDNV